MSVGMLAKTISAELLKGGLLITFSNGDEGLYSEELLRASLPNAQALLADVLKHPDNAGPPL